jgi:hypothetical protein
MAVSCASSVDPIKRLNDGSYRLECRDTLANCLAQAEKPCAAYGYEVLSGRQETRVFGPEQVQSTFVSSEAIVMCRNADGLFDHTPQPGRPAEVSHAPKPLTQALACVPGASQSCTGPAGCKGGQTCAPDGRAYLACDCGEVPQASKLPAAPDATATSSLPADPSSVPVTTTTPPLASPPAPQPANTGAPSPAKVAP